VGIRSDRSYRFDESRAVVWEALTRIGHYRDWWPWLRQFDGERFAVGEHWRCVVKAPLPYSLRFEIELVEVVAPDRARAELTGDIAGRAEIALSDAAHGSVLRLTSDLTGTSGLIGALDRLLRPVAAFGHDWVLDNGIRQFRAAAFD
jgi:uncharacterized protein YndB with AHSA1/START domain